MLSCHVSPDGKRLATGGLDGQVKIWAVDSILNARDLPENAPKQLASLSTHSGTVSVVRFSGTNQFLASGSDDRVVLVYERDTSGARPVFGSGEAHETWRTARRLTGHDNDVQDLGWSVDSSILVSVGLDSKIIVWSGYTFEKLKVIDAHQSHVKGITFDPANKYFATASDDRTIKIFRFTPPPPTATIHDQISNFVLEHTITKPFESSPLTTYFRRCSWSPDGSHIAAANATNGPVSSVAIITRGQWDSDINLIGHENPVEVCAFSPRMFSKDKVLPASNGKPAAANLVTVIACAGQDKALSVWNTSHPRPLLITQQLAEKVLTDLAWAPDGQTLFTTSLDGTITVLVFEDGDLGYVAPIEENERILSKFGTGRKGAGFPESVEMVHLEEKAKEGELREAEGRMGELMGSGADGTAGTAAAGFAQAAPPAPVPEAPAPAQEKEPKVLKQKITITKEGKKRVAPLLVSTTASQRSNMPSAQLLQQATGGPAGPSGVTLELSRPYDKLPKGGLATLISGNKRAHQQVEEEEQDSRKKRAALPVLNGTSEPAESKDDEAPEFIRPAVVNPALLGSQVRLAVPKIRSVLTHMIMTTPTDASKSTEHELTLEAKNYSGTFREPTRITVSKSSNLLWTEYLPRAVMVATGNSRYWALGCEDGTIHVYSPTGRRLANALVLEAQPVFLECKDWWLMCATAVGMCHVWNIQSLSSPHPPVSVAPVLDIANTFSGERPSRGESIMEAGVSSQGILIVALTNGEGYAYSKDLYTWQRLSEPWWIFGSEYFSSNRREYGMNKVGIVQHLERLTASQTILNNRGQFLSQMIDHLDRKGTGAGFRKQVSIGHLENRLAAALQIGSKDDFKSYLLMYARALASENLATKAEELCKELLGSMDADSSADSIPDDENAPGGAGRWGAGDEILGMSKMELLKGVVLAMGKYRELQRIITPYAQMCGVVGEGDEMQS